MAHPWSVGIAVALLASGGYCLGRVLIAQWRPTAHGVDVDLGHALMSAAMVAMLWWPLPASLAWLQVGLFSVGALWFMTRGLTARHRSVRHPARARIGVMSAVMAAMLVPAAAAGAAPRQHDMHDMGSMQAMRDSAGTELGGGLHGLSHAGMPVWLAVVLLAVSVGIGAWALRSATGPSRSTGPTARGGPSRSGESRLGPCCEAVMAGAMALMTLAALG